MFNYPNLAVNKKKMFENLYKSWCLETFKFHQICQLFIVNNK